MLDWGVVGQRCLPTLFWAGGETAIGRVMPPQPQYYQACGLLMWVCWQEMALDQYAGFSSTVVFDQVLGVDRCCMSCQQPGWDTGPLWNGRLQLAGSVASTVQYDCRVIKELWAAVHLQTGLLHMPMCIFIRLGSIVGGRARSAMFSACKATRGLCALVVSTNLHIELQVGMFNQGFGQCMDTLSALCGREFMRASNRRVDNGVLKIHIHPFPCPQLDVLHLQASDPEGGPCSWVVKLDGSTVASEDSELFSRFRRELPDGTAVLHFNVPTHHSRESFFSWTLSAVTFGLGVADL